jgi:hypothetical protein
MTKRTLLGAALAVGASISLPALLQGKVTSGLVGFSVGAVLFGGLTYLWNRFRRSRLAMLGELPERFPVRPILTLEIDEPARKVVDAVAEWLQENVGEVEKSTTGVATWQLTTFTSKSWFKGIGERIDVVVSSESDYRTSLKVASRPRLSTIVLDWGRNYENVQRIQLAVSESIGESRVRVLGLDEQTASPAVD